MTSITGRSFNTSFVTEDLTADGTTGNFLGNDMIEEHDNFGEFSVNSSSSSSSQSSASEGADEIRSDDASQETRRDQSVEDMQSSIFMKSSRILPISEGGTEDEVDQEKKSKGTKVLKFAEDDFPVVAKAPSLRREASKKKMQSSSRILPRDPSMRRPSALRRASLASEMILSHGLNEVRKSGLATFIGHDTDVEKIGR